MPHIENPPIPAGPAAPGQTNAHQQPTIHDPMRNMKIAFGGDQLTRVHFAGAKDLLHHQTDLNIALRLNL